MVLHMKRKLREISGCLVITIPHQVAELFHFQNGDYIDIETIGIGELRLKKSSS